MSESLKQPTFLIGAERSGTTLLRLMLDHHPRISFNPEFEYAVSQMDDDGQTPAMDAYHHFLRTDFIFPGAEFDVDPALPYHDLVKDFLRQKLARDGKELIGATVHHHFDRLLHIWPEARFIHILRDPRDVARSTIGMGWAANTWVGAQRWLEAEQIWERMRGQLPEDRYTDIRYESLIQNPREELARLCRFMGTEYDEAIFDYVKTSTYDEPDPKLVFQWRKKLSEEDIALVETRVGAMLSKRGYDPSGLPPLEVTAEMDRRFERESKLYGRRLRLKRYGLPLFLAGWLSRKLPFQGLRDHLRLRMNAIDMKHVK